MDKMLEKLSKFILKDCRTEAQRQAEDQRLEQKIDREFKEGEIGCFFIEIQKIQKEREDLSKKGQSYSPKFKQLNSEIAEGIADLEKEIQAYKKMLQNQGQPSIKAEEFLRRWAEIRYKEDTLGHVAGGKVSLRPRDEETSELQDLSMI